METPQLSWRDRSLDEGSHHTFQTEADGREKELTGGKEDGKVGHEQSRGDER